MIHDHELLRTTGEPARCSICAPRSSRRSTPMNRSASASASAARAFRCCADVLTLLEGRPEVTLFVEIKRASLARFGHEQVVGRVLETLKPARTQCVVISFDLAAVYRARQLGGLPIGWVLSDYDAAQPHQIRGAAAGVPVLRSQVAAAAARCGAARGAGRSMRSNRCRWRCRWPRAARNYIETMAVHEMSEALPRQPPHRRRAGRVNESDFDLVVVGAGIHGAGVAQAAAAAGHSVLLLEQTGYRRGHLQPLEQADPRRPALPRDRPVPSGAREPARARAAAAPRARAGAACGASIFRSIARTRRRPWQLRFGLSLYALLAAGDAGAALRHRAAARVGPARRPGHERPAGACSTTTTPRPTTAR